MGLGTHTGRGKFHGKGQLEFHITESRELEKRYFDVADFQSIVRLISMNLGNLLPLFFGQILSMDPRNSMPASFSRGSWA